MNDPRMPTVIAIIPIYRNGHDLLDVLPKFNSQVIDEICIVMDCIPETDSERIEQAAKRIRIPISMMSNEKRKGVGSAIRDGIKHALACKYDVAVIIAGNNKDAPQEIPRLLAPILEEGYDYVQGSRFLPGGRSIKNPFFRKVFSRMYPFFWTLITGVHCTDVTNGFRAYRLKIFSDSRINIHQRWLDSYQLEYYIHFKVLTLGYRTKEVPVSKTYPHSHRGGYSNISPFRDWWKIIGPLIYLALGAKE